MHPASSVAPTPSSFTAFSFITTPSCHSVLLDSLETQKSQVIDLDDKGHAISCYFLALSSDTPQTLAKKDISQVVRPQLKRYFGSRYPVEGEYKDSPADFAKEKEECDRHSEAIYEAFLRSSEQSPSMRSSLKEGKTSSKGATQASDCKYPSQWYTSDREFGHNASYLALAWSKTIQNSLGSSANKSGLASEVKVDIPLTDFDTWVSGDKLWKHIWKICKRVECLLPHLGSLRKAVGVVKRGLLQQYRSACLKYIEENHGHLVAYLPRLCFPHLPYEHSIVVGIQKELKTNPDVSTLYFWGGDDKLSLYDWLKNNPKGKERHEFREVLDEAFKWDEASKPFFIRMTWGLSSDISSPKCTYVTKTGLTNQEDAGDRTSS